jgi:hypothetical protein
VSHHRLKNNEPGVQPARYFLTILSEFIGRSCGLDAMFFSQKRQSAATLGVRGCATISLSGS